MTEGGIRLQRRWQGGCPGETRGAGWIVDPDVAFPEGEGCVKTDVLELAGCVVDPNH